MREWVSAQVQTGIFDHVSRKGSVRSAKEVPCQHFTRGSINQTLLKAAQSHRARCGSILDFEKQEAAPVEKIISVSASPGFWAFGILWVSVPCTDFVRITNLSPTGVL